MRVLVCGGRDFTDGSLLSDFLKPYRETATVIIHGGASGADRLAGKWARIWRVPERVFEADWSAHGKAAGPRRNAQMISEGRPDLVIAFPGGRGTADMVSRAEKAGIRVVRVPLPSRTGGGR